MLGLSYQAIPGGPAGPVIPLEDFSAQIQPLSTWAVAGSAQQAGMGKLALPPAFLPSSSQLPSANSDASTGQGDPAENCRKNRCCISASVLMASFSFLY